MKAAVLESTNKIVVRETDDPVPREGEVLVRVHYTGVCGSDVPRALRGQVHGFPLVLGHEFSGEVVAAGSLDDQALIGKRVAGIPLVPCGECSDCKRGFYSLCDSYSFIGSRRNGSMAEYVCLPVANVYPVREGIDDLEAAFFEPATVALHAISLAKYFPEGAALVVGSGTIGALLAQCLLACGAESVVVCNRSEDRLRHLRSVKGIEGISTSREGWRDRAMEACAGRGFDFVFDTVACSQTISDSFKLAGSRATVCFVGTPKQDVSLSVRDWELVNRKELTVTGSWMSYSDPFPGSEWTMAADFFSSGTLKILEGMIDEVYPLDETPRAFERFASPGGVTGKVLIDSWRV